MNNYFRVTAYHPAEDISVILDSNGLYSQIWQFSSMLVQKGFKIIQVGDTTKFEFDSLPPLGRDTERILLRSYAKGKPIITGNTIEVGGEKYKTIGE